MYPETKTCKDIFGFARWTLGTKDYDSPFFGFGIFIHIFHTFNKYILGGRVMAVSKDKALTLMGIVFE